MIVPGGQGRVAAIAFGDDQQCAAVWLAHAESGVVTVASSCLFSDLPLDRVAEGLRARGDMAIAWKSDIKPIANRLLNEFGCNMVPERDAVQEHEAMAAMLSRELADRLRDGRLVVGEREAEWKREYDSWRRSDIAVPCTPLLSATRLALARLDYARPPTRGPRQPNHPLVSIV